MEVNKPCGHCGKPEGKQRCSRCKVVYYCGRECQQADWKEHKKTCGAAPASPEPPPPPPPPPPVWRPFAPVAKIEAGGARRRRVDPVHGPRQRRQHVLRQLGGAVPAPRRWCGRTSRRRCAAVSSRLRHCELEAFATQYAAAAGRRSRRARSSNARRARADSDGRHARLAGARADADREPPRGEHARQPAGTDAAEEARLERLTLTHHLFGFTATPVRARAAATAPPPRAAATLELQVVKPGEEASAAPPPQSTFAWARRRRARRRLRLRRRQRQRAAADDGRAAARGVHRGGGARPALAHIRARDAPPEG